MSEARELLARASQTLHDYWKDEDASPETAVLYLIMDIDGYLAETDSHDSSLTKPTNTD